MKTLTYFSVISIAVFMLHTNISFAQYAAGSGLISLTGAYTIMTIEDTDAKIDGGGFQLGYERSNLTGNLAFGGGLGYLVGIENLTDGQIRYSTLPLWVFGKYLLGPEKAKFYFSLGVGYQISDRQFSGDVTTIQDVNLKWDSGISFGAGAGVNYYFNEKICGIVSYNLQFLNNYYTNEGLAHVFNFGLGFQIN